MKIKFLAATAFLAIAILYFGAMASAQAFDIQALIAQLQTQIQQLIQQIAQLRTQQGTTAWCHTFNLNLKYGDSGNEVENLETALKKEGLEAGSAAGHYFYDQTAATVVEFQEKYASEILTPSRLKRGTGYVGTATRKKLNALYGCGTIPVAERKQCATDADCPVKECTTRQCNNFCTIYKCQDGKCVESGTTSITDPCPTQNCKELWWFDNDSKICRQKQFCGAYAYQGLRTFETQKACQEYLDVLTGKSCSIDANCGTSNPPHYYFNCVNNKCVIGFPI